MSQSNTKRTSALIARPSQPNVAPIIPPFAGYGAAGSAGVHLSAPPSWPAGNMPGQQYAGTVQGIPTFGGMSYGMPVGMSMASTVSAPTPLYAAPYPPQTLPPLHYAPANGMHYAIPANQPQQLPYIQPYTPQSFYAMPQFATPAPRTTAAGYTLSSAYIPSPLPPPRTAGPGPTRDRTKPSKANKPSVPRPPKAPKPAPAIVVPVVFTCRKAECGFSASQRLVREHEEDRHLIYAPGREPKPWVSSIKPGAESARIEGSSISLDSPEAIAKWIEDRKKRWPSIKVVEDKERSRAERVAAGLEPEFSGRGRGRGRGRGERGSRGGRGGGRGGRGREDSFVHDERDVKRHKAQSSSSSSSEDDTEDSDADAAPLASSSKLPVPSLAESAPLVYPTSSVGLSIHPSRQDSHHLAAMSTAALAPITIVPVIGPASLPSRRRPAPASLAHNPFSRPDPFAQFAERDISHFTAEILQIVDFLFRNDFLQTVETRAGMVEEESGIQELMPEAVGLLVDVNEGDKEQGPLDEETKLTTLVSVSGGEATQARDVQMESDA